MLPEGQTYDLSVACRNRSHFDLPIRVASVVGGLLGTAGGVAVVAYWHGLGGSRAGLLGIGIFILVTGACAVGFGAWLPPGPTAIRVTDLGVFTDSPSRGSRQIVRWTDFHLNVVLQDFRASTWVTEKYLRQRTGVMWIAPGVHGFDLTPEAFAGIIDTARRIGVTVKLEETPGPLNSASHGRVTITRGM